MANLKYIGKNILNHTLEIKKGDVSGSSTSTGSFGSVHAESIYLNDNDRINMGDNDDLQIFHLSSGNGIIQNAGSGQLQLRGDTIRLLNAATTKDFAFFNNGGSVDLYYDNIKSSKQPQMVLLLRVVLIFQEVYI